jgi:excisionase family DNA binding protein
LLTVQDVAHRFNVPVSWVYARPRPATCRHLKIGRYVRFRPDEIRRYLEARQQGAG